MAVGRIPSSKRARRVAPSSGSRGDFEYGPISGFETMTAVMTCALHGTAFSYGCPGCDAAENWQIVGEVAPRLEDECAGHKWSELEPEVYECVLCGCLRFENATMAQLQRHLLGDEIEGDERGL